MSPWVRASVRERQEWAPGLITLRFDAEIEPFEPGQWLNLALEIEGERVRRAYSLASAPGEAPELYVNLVPGGGFTPRLFALHPGDLLEIERKPQGFFTLRWLPQAEELWMVATGTGLGPFISMLRSEETWQRFRRIVLVHGVREVAHLSYADEAAARSKTHGGRLVRVPVVSRDPTAADVIHGRVTSALASRELERAAGLELSSERSHVMLCGNPEMIAEMSALLEQRGLAKHRQKKPGHVSAESYW